MKYISEEYQVTNEQQLVLPISMYLVGYVVGPPVCGPLSEAYGRQIVMLWTFVIYTSFTLACALSPNWPALLVFRLIVGMAASSPIAVVGGLYADVYSDPRKRGRAMAYFMAATTFGPILGPIISGFISVVSWRWTFWIGLILAGVTLPLVVFLPETYAPIILLRRAKRLRKESGNDNFLAPKELEKKGVKQMMTITLTRPIRMIIYEALVLFTCLYLSLAYAIFYMYFQAYPIVFQG
jgi:multidrug resistance protein